MFKDLKAPIKINSNILMIDDDPICLMAGDLMLSARGYNFIKANCAERGLASLLKNSKVIDLILLDIDMPGQSGLELLGVINHNSSLKHIPVVLQSSAGYGSVEHLSASGVSEYINKPYTTKTLFRVVEEVLNKYSLTKSQPNTNNLF